MQCGLVRECVWVSLCFVVAIEIESWIEGLLCFNVNLLLLVLSSGLVDREKRESFVRTIPMLSWVGGGHPTSFYLLLHRASW